MSYGGGQDAREQVRHAVDIVDLVGSYLDLRRQGRVFVALCPWHNDSRPSLQVNPQRQSWKCWVCDLGGDVFSFVMQQEGVGFAEALRLLADRAGIELAPQRRQPAAAAGSPEDKATLYRALAWAEQQFHRELLHGREADEARSYLRQRGISGESLERFQLGYSPSGWNWLLDQARGSEYSAEVLEAAGLIGRSERGRWYDRFRSRLIFSIRDSQQRALAFGGRILPGNADPKAAKYVNSPETRLFSKSEQLYGLNLAMPEITRSREVFVMEGYTDVIAAAQAGLGNSVAVLGTALGATHVRHLKRLADRIVLVLDGDAAGQKRATEVLELFVAAEVDIRIMTLPGGQDPCEFVQAAGVDAFRELADAAEDALDYKLRVATAGLDLLQDTHRAHQALESILATLGQAPRLSESSSQSRWLREQQLMSRLARTFRLPEHDLRARLEELRKQRRGPNRRSEVDGPAEGGSPPAGIQRRRRVDGPGGGVAPHPPHLSPWEREWIQLLVRHPQLAVEAGQTVSVEHLESPAGKTLYRVYLELSDRTGTPDFNQLLDAVETPVLKSLLVTLDEEAERKEEYALADAQLRFQELLDRLWQRQLTRRRADCKMELREPALDVDKELELLTQLLNEERERQGISSPTDG